MADLKQAVPEQQLMESDIGHPPLTKGTLGSEEPLVYFHMQTSFMNYCFKETKLKMFAIKDRELIMKSPGSSSLKRVTGYLFSRTVRGTNFKTEDYKTRKKISEEECV